MQPGVVVTGIGIVSAIGIGTEETLTSLLNKRSGIAPVRWLETIHSGIPVAEVSHSTDELAEIAGTSGQPGIFTRNTLLAMIAAGQSVEMSEPSGSGLDQAGLVMATTVGGMDYNEKHYRSLLAGKETAGGTSVLDSSDTTEKLAARFGILRNVTTISTACSSSANAIMLASRLIRNGKLTRVLAGGSDALTIFTLNGFRGLELLSPTGCRPFDAHRDGLTLGEGAAVLMLESDRTADMSKALCRISGYANVNEAFHQTSASPDGAGAFMAMSECLESAGLEPWEIGYINAHGTGTEMNDRAEALAIERLFGRKIPPVSSTKAFTGHTLGAAGAIEAVISVLAIREQKVWPSIHINEVMPEISFLPPNDTLSVPVGHVMSNSFGFGGNNTSLIFSEI
ncbi:MAG: beta-ketoacyl-[acyl-carrier-protein] synthase family protein [Bacteroidales bacterium]|nr:beta-ketoacyl-[acyl-carrier-protein] synthase family protein [Bacteroidales bacterium]HPM18983.1 beta-ketoacyl-[acyl-carrier-protein] synthase family protein [Bacteroidales bacterium]HQG77100.1 beta-ketoacyl-[acyl-carrier-protein] synthase family protein [Bacteroidales bacterium]